MDGHSQLPSSRLVSLLQLAVDWLVCYSLLAQIDFKIYGHTEVSGDVILCIYCINILKCAVGKVLSSHLTPSEK